MIVSSTWRRPFKKSAEKVLIREIKLITKVATPLRNVVLQNSVMFPATNSRSLSFHSSAVMAIVWLSPNGTRFAIKVAVTLRRDEP